MKTLVKPMRCWGASNLFSIGTGLGHEEERRALELSPNSSDAHTEYGFYLAVMGRSDEAITQIQKALELDPVPVFRTVNMGCAISWRVATDDAIVHLKRAVELNPDYPAAHMELAWAYARKGMRAEAKR